MDPGKMKGTGIKSCLCFVPSQDLILAMGVIVREAHMPAMRLLGPVSQEPRTFVANIMRTDVKKQPLTRSTVSKFFIYVCGASKETQ